MGPAQLSRRKLCRLSSKGRALAVAHLALLQDLPLGFAPFLLREIIVFDWNFRTNRAN